MRVLVLGVPGVGKTSICKEIGNVVNFGDVMFKIAKEKYGIEHRDKMRKELKVEDYKKVQEEAAEEIGKMKEAIIDTHASIFLHNGYYPGMPLDILTKIKPHAIIVIEAKPEEIVKRRIKDEGKRERRLEIKQIEEHQKINRYFASAMSVISGAPLFFVENEEGKLESTIKKVKEILSMI